MATIELYEDPARFLREAGEYLAADPVQATVMATVSARCAAEDAAGRPRGEHPRWWAVARGDSGAVVGVAMRSMPVPPYAPWLMPMPDDAVRELAALLHQRGERLGASNGALAAARAFAEEAVRLQGGRIEVREHTRLFELPGPPQLHRSAPGRLRRASGEDLDLCVRWFGDFGRDVELVAGRDPLPGGHGVARIAVADRVADGVVWLWEVDGAPVQLTATQLPAYGVVRVGPVFTPAEHRGHGYASSAVAEVSRGVLAAGHRACLFTDQANPTSNRIYEALGYRRVVDTALHVVVRGPGDLAGQVAGRYRAAAR